MRPKAAMKAKPSLQLPMLIPLEQRLGEGKV
jgi:hypothetical protein